MRGQERNSHDLDFVLRCLDGTNVIRDPNGRSRLDDLEDLLKQEMVGGEGQAFFEHRFNNSVADRKSVEMAKARRVANANYSTDWGDRREEVEALDEQAEHVSYQACWMF